MQNNFIAFEESEWWILVILITSFLLTWFLYSIKKRPWTGIQNRILFGLRFLGISLALLLLLEPLVDQTVSREEKPIIALAIDNSQSIGKRGLDTASIKNELRNLTLELENQGIEVQTFLLSNTDSLRFNEQTTNLQQLLSAVENEMEGRNWVASVLASDGLINRGSSPIYANLRVPHFAVGLGDTIPPKDINISRVQYNRVTYKGNQTPIKVELTQEGYSNRLVNVRLEEGSKLIEEKRTLLSGSINEVDFLTTSEEEGLRKLTITVEELEEEFVSQNNRTEVFMDVIDGRKNVLIVARNPHPDIKAIRSSLENTNNYTTQVYIPSLSQKIPTDAFDVVIYHGALSGRIRYTPKGEPGIWYILNERSSLNLVNQTIPYLNIKRRGGQSDRVSASINQTFAKFEVKGKANILDELPPISVPFGDYGLSGPASTFLFQKVGTVTTSKPLFTFYDDGATKSAILLGQNIWKWKFQEAALNGNSALFDEIVNKTVQFLSVKNTKKQFRFQTRSTSFSALETVQFDAEVYNKIYDRVYGNKISLVIMDSNGNASTYEFVDSELNSSFNLPISESGIYQFEASVRIDGETLRESGQFLVEDVNNEFLNLTANHNLLKGIAQRSGGEFVHSNDLGGVPELIQNRNFKSLIRKSESNFPLIQEPLILLLIAFLFASEWILRKYWGGY